MVVVVVMIALVGVMLINPSIIRCSMGIKSLFCVLGVLCKCWCVPIYFNLVGLRSNGRSTV